MLSCDRPNIESKLIKHVIENKLINPLLLVDVGARGGINPIWNVFQPLLRVAGFDIGETDCLPYALSNEKGKRKFYQLDYGASSSFYLPDKKFTNRLRDARMLDLVAECEVETHTLDEFNLQPDFLKIDAEGAELDILKGSLESLKYLIGVEVEVEFFQERIGQPVFSEVDTFLRGQGFNLYNMRLLRYPRTPYNQGEYYVGKVTKGQIMSAHCVYFRDLIPILSQVSKDKLLKQTCIMDLLGIPDCAIENLVYSKNDDLIPLVDASECYV